MMLHNKNAVIYGGGGSLGGAVASAFAAAGARVFLAGRTSTTLEIRANEIRKTGGRAETAVVDALDISAVHALLENIRSQAGTIDISFCAIDHQVVQNMPLTEMNVEDFVRPVAHALRAQFVTATAVVRLMEAQGSGVILTLTATPGGIGYPYTGGFAPACAAVESFVRNLASEIGPRGVRVVNIRSAGTPDSRIFKQAIESQPEIMAPIVKSMEEDTMLKRLPRMNEVADTAVFLASDLASGITGVTVDVTAGTTSGFNYKVRR